MWDVKYTIPQSPAGGDHRFYMNYVGCKVVITPLKVSILFGFYMNYVGCKVFINDLERCHYVMFYMNYVGCKEYSCLYAFSLTFLVLYELCGM